MILTNCAACAAPLPRLAKQCSRCQTRYCNVERLLRTLLTHQLDWSLDDLELDSAEQQIVDRLADLPAASYGMNAVHYMRYISSAGF